MVARAFSVAFFITLIASSVQATAQPGADVHALLSRQLGGIDPSDFPAQCQDQCTSVTNTLSSGSCNGSPSAILDCLCNSKFSGSLSSCGQCAAKVSGSDSATIKSAYDNYAQACRNAGKPVPDFAASTSGSSGNSALRSTLAGMAGTFGMAVYLSA